MREMMARARRRTAAVQARRRLRPRRLRRRARRIARAARRIAPGDRATAGPLRRRHRRQVVEDPAQQRARLFRRRHRPARREADGARRSTRPSSTARPWPDRSASPPPSSASWRRRSPTPPTARSASSLRSSSKLAAATIAASNDDQGRRRGAGRARRVECARDARGRAQLCSAGDRPLARLHRRGRPPRRGRAGDQRSVRRQRLRSVAAASDAKRGANLAAHRPEHGGQVDVPAPERADRRARADGRLRAGEARQDRRRRPAVLARRRRRRSRPRTLDLHGRDGGDRRDSQSGRRTLAGHPRRDRPRHRDVRRPVDRLGGDRASARDKPLPRAVRDAFPRADRARAASCRACTTPPCASRNGRARWCSCTR